MSEKKKKGLLGRIFGGGKEEPKKQPVPKKTQEKPNPVKVEKETKPVETPKPVKEAPRERAYLTKEESEKVYNKQEMEQTVFLFAPPEIILPVQKYINESFEGITCIGTSSISGVISEYQNKLNSRHVLIFVDNDTTLKQLKEFIGLVASIKRSNPELVNIYVALAKNVNDKIITGEDYATSLNIFRLKGEATKISEVAMDQIMSKIVKAQPVYKKEEDKKKPPKIARQKDILTMENPFRMQDINELRKSVQQAKANRDNSDNEVVRTAVYEMKSQKDVESLAELLPELSVLKTYGEQLKEYMESSRDKLPADKVAELALSQLELSVVQQETIKDIFSELVRSAEEEAGKKDRNIRHSTMEDVNELSDIKFSEDLDKDDEKIEEALALREEVRQKALEGFDSYKKEIKILSNAVEAQKQLIQGAQKQLMDTIQDNNEKLNPELVEAANLQLVYMNEVKEDIEKNKKALQIKMTDTLNYVSTVFKDYNILISIDDILIEKLVSDREKLKAANIKKVYNVENKLQLNSRLMVWSGVPELKDILKTTVQISSLVVTTMLDVDFGNRVESDLKTFLEKDYSFTPNIVKVNKNESEDVIGALVRKLKHLASSYNKVVFLFENDDQPLIDLIAKEVPEVVFVTGMSEEALLSTNMQLTGTRNITSLYAHTLLVYGYEEQIPYEELIVTVGAKPTDKIIAIKPIRDIETAKSTVILLRSV